MKIITWIGLGTLLSLTAACAAETSRNGEQTDQSNSALANPAAVHCLNEGYELVDAQCVFTDGSSCEEWAFFRGECKPGDNTPDAGPIPTPTPDAGSACTPLPAPGGSANPAAVYCQALGYSLDGSDCVFPDGTRCEEWSFWRGQCGSAHSFCGRQGGTVSSKTEDRGGWTATFALCTMPDGTTCDEQTFATTCDCK